VLIGLDVRGSMFIPLTSYLLSQSAFEVVVSLIHPSTELSYVYL